ncbi:PREDICTED: uncharacterized protein LOC108559594 [Nicrophorus vespilloides]|uniref:Uncharacterized protein LOC108559594 n=1 Tax=Nicrophorus vespilloides TaxID=110193 RepID=A0ABM1MCW5_NICVS|nr:PREDICTED: uncharacterized protein LOC108559594 [Nicrophorus vespilloides]
MKVHVLLVVVVLLVVCFSEGESKRSGGRGRSSSSRLGGLFNRNNKKKSSNSQKPVSADVVPAAKAVDVKPSAPKLETKPSESKPPAPKLEPSAPKYEPSAPKIETQKFQNLDSRPANMQQRPIGWDVGQSNQNTYHHQARSVNNFAYPVSGSYVNPGGHSSYPSHAGAYPNTGSYNYYGTGQNYNYGNGFNQQQPFPGYHPTSNIGVIPPSGANAGQYYNNVAGFGNQPMMGSHGQSKGIFGSLFGGGNSGGYGYGNNYGMYNKPRGFGSGFGSNAFGNVMIGLLVWNLFRGGSSQKYNVYNHYNKPEDAPKDIELPANLIMLCPENATALCAGQTTPLCTSNDTILCVATAATTIPCKDNLLSQCVNVTTPESDVTNLPCIANATVNGNVNLKPDENPTTFNATFSLFNQSTNQTDTVFCVTTLAVPYIETIDETNSTSSVVTESSKVELTTLTTANITVT